MMWGNKEWLFKGINIGMQLVALIQKHNCIQYIVRKEEKRQFYGQGRLFSCFQQENNICLGLYMVTITILFKHYMFTEVLFRYDQDLGTSSSERKAFAKSKFKRF